MAGATLAVKSALRKAVERQVLSSVLLAVAETYPSTKLALAWTGRICVRAVSDGPLTGVDREAGARPPSFDAKLTLIGEFELGFDMPNMSCQPDMELG